MQKPIILWGGVDINPKWYGEEPHPMTQKPNDARDVFEFKIARHAIEQGIPVVGICRGAQLLCVVNGGKLIQHVPEHQNCHHKITVKGGTIIKEVKADHHQVMIPVGNFELLGQYHNVPEIIWYPETKCLCVQPHPEWMPSTHPFNVWLNKLMKELEIDCAF